MYNTKDGVSVPQVMTDNNVVEYPYTAEDMCTLSGGSSERTFKEWVASFGSADGCPSEYRKRFSEGRNKRYYKYSETALKAFQDWRMRNQAYQGRASEETKDATLKALKLGNLTLAAFEDEKAWEELNQFRRVYFESKQNEQRLLDETKALTVRAEDAEQELDDLKNMSVEKYIPATPMSALLKEKTGKSIPMVRLGRKMGFLGENDKVLDTDYAMRFPTMCHDGVERLTLHYNVEKLQDMADYIMENY